MRHFLESKHKHLFRCVIDFVNIGFCVRAPHVKLHDLKMPAKCSQLVRKTTTGSERDGTSIQKYVQHVLGVTCISSCGVCVCVWLKWKMNAIVNSTIVGVCLIMSFEAVILYCDSFWPVSIHCLLSKLTNNNNNKIEEHFTLLTSKPLFAVWYFEVRHVLCWTSNNK